jgi:hypothetical protein
MRHLFTVILVVITLLVVFTMSSMAEEKVGEYTIYSAPGTDTTELKKWIDLLELVNQNIPVSFPMKGGD